MNMVRSAVLVLAGLCVVGVHATDWDAPQQVQVSYAGLDLKTTAGAQILYRRIEAAANRVCGGLYAKELGERRYKWKQCVNDSIARAVVDVDAPALTAYYASTRGKAEKPVALAGR